MLAHLKIMATFSKCDQALSSICPSKHHNKPRLSRTLMLLMMFTMMLILMMLAMMFKIILILMMLAMMFKMILIMVMKMTQSGLDPPSSNPNQTVIFLADADDDDDKDDYLNNIHLPANVIFATDEVSRKENHRLQFYH